MNIKITFKSVQKVIYSRIKSDAMFVFCDSAEFFYDDGFIETYSGTDKNQFLISVVKTIELC